jgi:hypothetical protein
MLNFHVHVAPTLQAPSVSLGTVLNTREDTWHAEQQTCAVHVALSTRCW